MPHTHKYAKHPKYFQTNTQMLATTNEECSAIIIFTPGLEIKKRLFASHSKDLIKKGYRLGSLDPDAEPDQAPDADGDRWSTFTGDAENYHL